MIESKGIGEQFNLDGKVALITGASKGIGKAIARGLAQCGAKVVVSSRKQEAVDALAGSFRRDGLQAVGMAAHMGMMDQARGVVDQVVEVYGRLDIVVNNAATNPVYGPVVQMDEGVFDKIMAVNLKGPFELCKRVQPVMVRQGGGSIINISSVEGLTPELNLGLYSVSKTALIGLTKVMAREWGPDDIRVNAICPGLIRTKFSRALWKNRAVLQRLTQDLPLRRIGQPEEIVGLAVFLASDAAAYCTGGVYVVDGGHTI